MSITWELKAFDRLSLLELHGLLRLRTDVFVVEQSCPYAEIDGLDPGALHLLGTADGALVCYARILPPETGDAPHIGRVVVRADMRGRGLARDLMDRAIRACEKAHGTSLSAVAAQTYLQRFYESLGYIRISDEYIWDGIPHIDMRRG